MDTIYGITDFYLDYYDGDDTGLRFSTYEAAEAHVRKLSHEALTNPDAFTCDEDDREYTDEEIADHAIEFFEIVELDDPHAVLPLLA